MNISILTALSPRIKIHLITFGDLIVIGVLIMLFPWGDSWALPSLKIALFWMTVSVAVTFSTTTLPLGRAVASVGDLVDVAGIAIAGPLPIIVANYLTLIVNALKEGRSRLHKLPFNLVLWTLAPLICAWIYYLIRPASEEILSIKLGIAVIFSFVSYSSIQLCHVSSAIAIYEGVSFTEILKKNYLYTEVASLATIPISIAMVVFWHHQGMIGVVLLTVPLLLVSVGLRVAFERGRLHEKIRRDNQLAELGKSAASILHEVGRPITRIAMEAEYAIGDEDGPEMHFTRILEWAREAGEITRDLLAVLAGQIQPQNIDPTVIIDEILDKLPAGGKERVIVKCDLPRTFTVFWDRKGIELVVTNLLMNALEAEPTSKVTLDIQAQMKRRLLLKHPISINIIVTDLGPGLPFVPLDKLFEPLFSTKSGGRGIGLFLCRQIAIAHGGSLTALDRQTRGAEFILSLPINPDFHPSI